VEALAAIGLRRYAPTKEYELMSIQFLLNNLHIAPFIVAFLFGAILLVLVPIKYGLRIGKVVVTPIDFTNYNDIERKILLWGIVLAFSGIIGAGFISKVYGYKYTVTDINGNTTIVNSKEDRSY
jgi:hypothetical protein